ncbi:hypothetical protein ITX31_06395 [Arthrobacter gandavensis]|uniref:hypothetical protein n=1 Tax=Arthrobacter gandavensis TaxID=169960 RepID=UPI001E330158|nr:hypothetical protein [Arthrobacter gandavensis]MBF4993737.1 hypothetical protein [Arthrobacter gandavensis]
MGEVLLAAAALAAAGFMVRGADPRRSTYGVFLPSGVALAAGLGTWIILQFTPVVTSSDFSWLSWALPVLAGPAAAVAAVLATVSRRLPQDNAERERILRL